jgi:hypothetical protein
MQNVIGSFRTLENKDNCDECHWLGWINKLPGCKRVDLPITVMADKGHHTSANVCVCDDFDKRATDSLFFHEGEEKEFTILERALAWLSQ